ncbi:MAG: hypothetical protein FWB90_05160 [Fibromonadales bacterium]|nr:hypothetical protein [Fibromonadales bacterium]
MSNHSLYFMLLALLAIIAVLAACGEGEIVDLADKNSGEFREYEKAVGNLAADEGGFIVRCGKDDFSEDEKNLCEKLAVYRPPEQSSSSSGHIQPGASSSSSSDDWIPPSYAELSSSSLLSSSSQSSGPINWKEVPSYTCFWNPNQVASGGKTQVNINFDSKNDNADRDCTKKAWLYIAGMPPDTAFFELGKDLTASGTIKGSATWPTNGGLLQLKSTVTCGKEIVTQDCNSLTVGTKTQSSSSSSSSRPSSSSANTSVQSSSSQTSTTPSSASGGCNGNRCLWNAFGVCYAVPSSDGKTIADCVRDGWLFQGGEEGDATLCKGGTFVKGCGVSDEPPKEISTSNKGCCKWNGGQCWDVGTDQQANDCKGNSAHTYWSQACPNKTGGCP